MPRREFRTPAAGLRCLPGDLSGFRPGPERTAFGPMVQGHPGPRELPQSGAGHFFKRLFPAAEAIRQKPLDADTSSDAMPMNAYDQSCDNRESRSA